MSITITDRALVFKTTEDKEEKEPFTLPLANQAAKIIEFPLPFNSTSKLYNTQTTLTRDPSSDILRIVDSISEFIEEVKLNRYGYTSFTLFPFTLTMRWYKSVSVLDITLTTYKLVNDKSEVIDGKAKTRINEEYNIGNRSISVSNSNIQLKISSVKILIERLMFINKCLYLKNKRMM